MRFLSALFAALLVVVVSACSPKTGSGVSDRTASPTPPAPASAPQTSYAPTERDTALLWRISGPGVPQTSYLFGTIHLIPEEDYFLPTGMVAALNDADEVVFEIEPDAMSNPMAMMGLMTKINMRGDTSLEDLLTAAEYATVTDYFNDLGLPFFLLKRMKPMFLSSMVGQDFAGLQPGAGTPRGIKSYEMEMNKLAKAADKTVSGLETMEFQLSLFDSIPYRGQAQMLYQAVVAERDKTDETGPSEMDKIVDLYKRKAIAEMARTVSEEGASTSRFEELLLTRRNESWVPIIREKIGGEAPKLFAVGAAHLGGERGVIALLRRAGLRVEPVY